MSCRFRLISVAVISVVLSTVLAATPVGAQSVFFVCNGVQATIVGTDADDILRGTPGPDVIAGLDGNDTIRGLGGDDIICGGSGDDEIFGGLGLDIIFGSEGNDTLFAVNGRSVEDRQDTHKARLFGGDGDDVIFGSNRFDRILGGNGNDRMLGFEGQDTMRGGTGADRIVGGSGIDDLRGGSGWDTIFLTDQDSAHGGVGQDLCRISNGTPTILTSCGADVREMSQPKTDDPSSDPVAETPNDAPTIEPEPVEDPPPAPAPPVPASGLEAGFSVDGENGTEWDGRIYGVVPVAQSSFAAQTGRCFLIVGELTPTTIPTGIVSRGFEAPTLGVIAGDSTITGGSGCDTTAAAQLGYDDVFDAEALLGTTIPIYRQIFIPDTNTAPLTSLVVRGPLVTSSIVAPARILNAVPFSPDLTVGPPVTGLRIGADTVPFNTFEGAEWDVDLIQVLESSVDPRVDRSGRCYLVLGSITATVVSGTVNSGFETPTISGIVDGRHVDDVTICDTRMAETGGFVPIGSGEAALGESFRFYSTIFVDESRTGPLSHVIVGRANLDGHIFEVDPPAV